MGPENSMAMWECALPKAKHELRIILGLCIYQQRFMVGFVYITTPLIQLTEEKQTFQLFPEAKAAFRP
jgi:hypothetical protein